MHKKNCIKVMKLKRNSQKKMMMMKIKQKQINDVKM